jgi:hypothetical protein
LKRIFRKILVAVLVWVDECVSRAFAGGHAKMSVQMGEVQDYRVAKIRV